MAVDWASYKLHRERVARDHGIYIGLLDENGEPLMDCPPVIDAAAPKTRNVPVSARLQFSLLEDGLEHPLAADLLGKKSDDWFKVDSEGKLVTDTLSPTRFFVVERPGDKRRTYRLTHALARGGLQSPTLLEAHGFDMLKMLFLLPAFSAPTTVTGVWTEFTRDWAGPEDQAITFKKPRSLQDMKMLTVADGGTVEGPAETVIRQVITETIGAAMTAIGAVDAPIVVDQTATGLDSPHILLRPTDGPLLDEITSKANDAGVHIDVYMWLPGDSPVAGHSLTEPTIVVAVKQMVGVSDGS